MTFSGGVLPRISGVQNQPIDWPSLNFQRLRVLWTPESTWADTAVYYDAKSFDMEYGSRCDYGPSIPRY